MHPLIIHNGRSLGGSALGLPSLNVRLPDTPQWSSLTASRRFGGWTGSRCWLRVGLSTGDLATERAGGQPALPGTAPLRQLRLAARRRGAGRPAAGAPIWAGHDASASRRPCGRGRGSAAFSRCCTAPDSGSRHLTSAGDTTHRTGPSTSRVGGAGTQDPCAWRTTSSRRASAADSGSPGRTRNIHRPAGVAATGPGAPRGPPRAAAPRGAGTSMTSSTPPVGSRIL